MEKILYFDICAILISIIFIVAALIRKNIRGRNNYLMFWIILLVFFSSVGDLGAAIMEDCFVASKWSITLSYLFSYLYFLAHNLIMPLYLFFIYSSIGIWHQFDEKRYLIVIWTALTGLDIAMLLFNLVYPVIFSYDANGHYVRGSMILIFYLVAILLGIWGIVIVIANRKLLRKESVFVLIILYPIVASTIVIQWFFPHSLCEMFGVAISLMFFIIVVQNSVDPLVGAKRYSSGIENLMKIMETHRPATILLVKMVNNGNILMYLGQDIYNRFLRILSEQFTTYAKEEKFKGDLFYLDYGLYGFLSEEDSLTESYLTAEKIRIFMSQDQRIDEFDILVDARICIVQCPDDFDDFQSIYAFATTFQTSLPQTKNILLYSDFKNQREFRIKRDLEQIMNTAIAENRFQMYYQPIYSTTEHTFVSAEALIWLKDNKYGFIPPNTFLPIAEQNGSIHAIGDFVLRDVMRFISEVNLQDLGLDDIQINLAASQCIESDLVDKVTALLEEYKVAPSQITFELTENAADIDPAIVDNNVRRLSNLGIRFALDDYGTSYSNTKRVTALPISQVKLDKNFVDEVDDPQMWVVIQETIAMLKEMGKEVLVEGVEEEAAARKFIDLKCDLLQGCELIQGFYFCKPLPEEEFVAFIRKHKSERGM